MATTTVPAALALLAGSTGAPTNNNGNQPQGLNSLTKALLAAMSTFPSASPMPVSTLSFLTQPQNQAAGTQAAANNLCEVRLAQ